MNVEEIKQSVLNTFESAGITLSDFDQGNIEIADFGLGKIEVEGLQLITYINNERYCAKDLVLLPGQTCPEHRHPPRRDDQLGKQETFRCRYGVVYLFVEGECKEPKNVLPPEGKEAYYTVKKQITLRPGEQYTIGPNVKHWFIAGESGAIISEYSSQSDDSSDIFTDPHVVR